MDFIHDDVYFFINKGRLIVPVRQTKIYPQARAHSRRYSVLEQEYKSRDVRSARSLFEMERSAKMATLAALRCGRRQAPSTPACRVDGRQQTVHTVLPAKRRSAYVI